MKSTELMTNKFNPGDAQTWFSSKFWKDHVFVGDALQKKKAETVFQRRDVKVSSVVCLNRAELVTLAGEVHKRQTEFARASVHSKFTTRQSYDIWSRGTPRPPASQRTRQQQTASHKRAPFRYSVREQPDGRFVIHHFDG